MIYALTDPEGLVIQYPYTGDPEAEGVVEVVDIEPPALVEGQTLDEDHPVSNNGVYVRNWVVHDWLPIEPDGLYAKVVDGEVVTYPYTLSDLKRDWHETSFPTNPRQMDGEWGVVAVAKVEAPDVGEGEVAEDSCPIGPPWVQAWTVRDLTPEELAVPVPQVVTMRQARLALLTVGKLAQAEEEIDKLPSPQKEAARIEWEYATEVRRDWPFVNMIAAALGWSSSELDDVFILAGSFDGTSFTA